MMASLWVTLQILTHRSCFGLAEVLSCHCSGERKSKTGWQAVTIQKRPLQPQGVLALWPGLGLALGLMPPEQAAHQQQAALLAVQQALQDIPPPHHITHYLDCCRHTDPMSGPEHMYYITK